MAYRPVPDIRFCDLLHGDRGLHADGNIALLKAVRQRKAVNDRRQHTHMIGAGALHTVTAVLQPAPKIAAADDDAHLHTGFDAFFHHVADAADHVKVQPAMRVARQRLPADLQQDAAIFRLVHGEPLLMFKISRIYSIIISPA